VKAAYPACEKAVPMLEAILKCFDQHDEIRTFEKGKFEIVHIGGLTIGRAMYEPGGSGPFTSGPPWAHPAATSSM
jgi:hypothetical protein